LDKSLLKEFIKEMIRDGELTVKVRGTHNFYPCSERVRNVGNVYRAVESMSFSLVVRS